MEKYIKILTILFIIMFAIINYNNFVFAAPNSSKGFAEFDDAKAQKETDKLIEEQNKNISIGKSTNNYLDSLEVEGYKLKPEFDKQTLEYTIDGEFNEQEITIKATANDQNAKIDGIGKIKIEDNKNKYRIDVTAEAGTVRTYFIKIKEDESDDNSEEIQEVMTKETEEQIKDNIKDNKKISIIFITVIVICFIIVVVIFYKLKNNKRKH